MRVYLSIFVCVVIICNLFSYDCLGLGLDQSTATSTIDHVTSTSEKSAIKALEDTNEETLKQKEKKGNGEVGSEPIRTATGGFINTLILALSIAVFIGNGAFLFDSFWISK